MRDLAGDAGLGGIPFSAVAIWSERVGGVDPFWLIDRIRAIEDAQRANREADDG